MKKEKIIPFGLALSILLTSGCSIRNNNSNTYRDEAYYEETYDEPKVTEEIEETKTKDIYNMNNDFATVKSDTYLYDSDGNIISTIERYQKVFRISSNSTYAYVQTEDLSIGYVNLNELEILPDLFIEVDISDQTVKMYKDYEVILTTLTVTGKDSTPTRIGYFPISYKTYDTYLKGSDYCSHVYYWMPFDGGIGLHDASWRSEFGGDIYKDNGSHGCVNLPTESAKEIYETVDAGTMVLVHN